MGQAVRKGWAPWATSQGKLGWGDREGIGAPTTQLAAADTPAGFHPIPGNLSDIPGGNAAAAPPVPLPPARPANVGVPIPLPPSRPANVGVPIPLPPSRPAAAGLPPGAAMPVPGPAAMPSAVGDPGLTGTGLGGTTGYGGGQGGTGRQSGGEGSTGGESGGSTSGAESLPGLPSNASFPSRNTWADINAAPPSQQAMLAAALAQGPGQGQTPPAIDPAMLALALQGNGAAPNIGGDFGGGFGFGS
jgi:hypothetical protein